MSRVDPSPGARGESIRNLPPREPATIAPDAPARQAALALEGSAADAVFVCDRARRAVGVIAARELLAAVLAADAPSRTAGDVMRRDVPHVSEDATLGAAADAMRASGQAHIAVLDAEGRLAGSVTDLDIITYLAESNPKEAINLPPVDLQVMDTREGG